VTALSQMASQPHLAPNLPALKAGMMRWQQKATGRRSRNKIPHSPNYCQMSMSCRAPQQK